MQDWGFANSTIGVGVTNYGTFTVGGGPVQDIAGFGVTINGSVDNIGGVVQALDGGFISLTSGLNNQPFNSSTPLIVAAGVATYGNTQTPAEIDITGCVTNAGTIQAGSRPGSAAGRSFSEMLRLTTAGVIAAYRRRRDYSDRHHGHGRQHRGARRRFQSFPQRRDDHRQHPA